MRNTLLSSIGVLDDENSMPQGLAKAWAALVIHNEMFAKTSWQLHWKMTTVNGPSKKRTSTCPTSGVDTFGPRSWLHSLSQCNLELEAQS